MNRESGFTLIEVVASLVLVGMMATVVGMGLVTGIKGYLFTKENTHMAQKSQQALARLSRELMELTDISSATSSSIIFERISGDRAIALVGDHIKIRNSASLPTEATGDILIDNVDSFSLSYFMEDQTSWVYGTDDIKYLTEIRIDFDLTRPESGGEKEEFSTSLFPRNKIREKEYGFKWHF